MKNKKKLNYQNNILKNLLKNNKLKFMIIQ